MHRAPCDPILVLDSGDVADRPVRDERRPGDERPMGEDASFPDDLVVESNTPGALTFATAGPDTRTTQLFINYVDNSVLDDQGIAPIGRVVEGMPNIEAINTEHGEAPSQSQILSQGNAYLAANFPNPDSIHQITRPRARRRCSSTATRAGGNRHRHGTLSHEKRPASSA